MQKVLTCCVAASNKEKVIEQCLNSFCDERVLDLIEVIIVNDGSTDNTPQIVENFVNMYPNTFKLINKKNGGYGSTYNVGITNAKGKYYRIVDGDDWVETSDFCKLVYWLSNNDCDLVFTNYYTFSCFNESKSVVSIDNTKSGIIEEWANVNGNYKMGGMHSLTVKRDIIADAQIYTGFYVDNQFTFWAKCRAKTSAFLEYCVYVYRTDQNGQSMDYRLLLKHSGDLKSVYELNCTEYLSNQYNLSDNLNELLISELVELGKIMIVFYYYLQICDEHKKKDFIDFSYKEKKELPGVIEKMPFYIRMILNHTILYNKLFMRIVSILVKKRMN